MSEKIAKVKSLILNGRDAVPVCVEAMISSPGIGIHMVGLPDREVKESLLRVCTALLAAGFSVPGAKIVINITPMPQSAGSNPLLGGGTAGLDAATAVAILEASGQTDNTFFTDTTPVKYVIGELGLNGELREVPGMLSFIRKAVSNPDTPMLFLPERGIPAGWEGLVGGGCNQVVAVSNITDLVACTRNSYAIDEGVRDAATTDAPRINCTDFLSVPGYARTKRVMQVAAAGGFDIALVGEGSDGKNGTFVQMFAQLLRDSLRGTAFDHSTGAALNASALGRYGATACLGFFPVAEPGPNLNGAVCGAVCAHNGVLALDNVSDIDKSVIEALRSVHEQGAVTISRLRDRVSWPAAFSLFISSDKAPVTDDPNDEVRFKVRHLCGGDQLWCWTDNDNGNVCKLTTADAASLVRRAVERQVRRQDGRLNADLSAKELEEFCLDKDGRSHKAFLQKIFSAVGLSASVCNDVLRTARTIADLDGAEHVSETHLCEAVAYKAGDRTTAA